VEPPEKTSCITSDRPGLGAGSSAEANRWNANSTALSVVKRNENVDGFVLQTRNVCHVIVMISLLQKTGGLVSNVAFEAGTGNFFGRNSAVVLSILSHYQIIILSHHIILSHIILSHYYIIISSHYHIITLSNYHIITLSYFHIITLSYYHIIISSYYPIIIFSHYHIITLSHYHIMTLSY